MRLQGWKTAAAGVLFCSLGWGAADASFGADGFAGWNAGEGTSFVLSTEEAENEELSGEISEVKNDVDVDADDVLADDSDGLTGGASAGDFDALADETAALRAELAALREETAALKVDFET
ncbi:MAG: hypothetical protein IKK39_10905, partial [Thermoguttaceae bacterium]|nr:hypothetical protein [Thermoguttaceae bacterium]